jgi:hypothetical protein
LPEWTADALPGGGALLIADDAVGGFFALNGGAIAGCAPGSVAYHAPDTLAWEDLGCGYSGFLRWSWSGALADFAADFRWDGWRDEVRALAGDRTMSVVPPLWAEGPPIASRSRRPVPVAELWGLSTGR